MRIATKLNLAFVLVLALSMTVLSVLVYSKSREAVHKELKKQLSNSAFFIEREVRRSSDNITRTSKIISLHPTISKALDLQVSRGVNRVLNRMIINYPFINYIMITTVDREIFAINSRDSHGEILDTESILGRTYERGLSVDELNEFGIIISRPILDKKLQIFSERERLTQNFHIPVMKSGKVMGWVVISYDWEIQLAKILTSLFEEFKQNESSIKQIYISTAEGEKLIEVGEYGKSVYNDFKPIMFGTARFNLHIQNYKAKVEGPLKSIQNYLLIVIVSINLAMLALILVVSRRLIIHPLEQVQSYIRSIGRGIFHSQIKFNRKDEIGELGRTLQTMVKELGHATVSKEYVDSILFSMAEMLIVLDAAGDITTINNEIISLLGYSEEELIGKPVSHIVKDYTYDSYDTVGNFETIQKAEMTFMTKNGREIPVLFTSSVMSTRDGLPIGVVCVALDITDRKKQEVSLREAKEAAEVANRFKSKFLSCMSHDIRTPLHAIMGVGELLEENIVDVELRRSITMLQRSGENLMALINDVLDFSKIEAGELTLEKIDFDLEDIIDQAISILAVKAYGKAIDISYRIDPDVDIAVSGDPYRLGQVFMNLIGNAIKFTDEGGVHLDVFQNQHGHHHFVVSDTGIGIPKDSLEKIFDEFSQADASTTREYGGTGLGLSICQRIIKMMRGALKVNSEVGKGSQFSFTVDLPRQEFSLPSVVLPRLENKKVLIVENNQYEKLVLHQLVDQCGGQVVEFNRLDVALAYISSGQKFDYLLADLGIALTGRRKLASFVKEHSDLIDKSIFIINSTECGELVKEIRTLGGGVASKPISREKVYSEFRHNQGAAEKSGSAQSDDVQVSSMTILVADDSKDNQHLISAFLKKYPVEITFVDDGQMAVDEYTSNSSKYRLILMDMQMPVKNGLEASRDIRVWEDSNSTSPIPIIALTASVLQEEVEACLAAGCTQHVAKPLKKAQLVKLLSSYS